MSPTKTRPSRPTARRSSRRPRLSLERLDGRIAPATLTWTGAVSTLWSDPGNWQGGAVPANGDTLVFPSVGVTNRTTTDDIASLTTLAGVQLDMGQSGRLFFYYPVTLTGASRWASGAIYPGGAFYPGGVTVTNAGALTLDNATTVGLEPGDVLSTFANAGTIIHRGAGDLYVGGDDNAEIRLVNQAGAVYDLQADAGILSNYVLDL